MVSMDFASNDLWNTLLAAQMAAIISMLATGLGPLPLLWGGDRLKDFLGEAYAFSGGLMFSASFFNLMGPGLERDHVWKVALGVFLGCLAFWAADRAIRNREWKMWDLEDAGARRIALIIGTMFIHSLPEGLAIGVAFGSGEPGFGLYMAVAITIHNIPEGLAIGVPMRSEGLSVGRASAWAIFSSLPQPIGALPALLAVWAFRPLLPYLLGFAAGAMMFLVLAEMLSEALEQTNAVRMAWVFMIGFLVMLLLQHVI
jgi:ZIP family zinc transporter